MKQFVKGVDWDEWEDIRYNEISIAGWYLTNHEDKELLEDLILIMEDDDEDMSIRKRAYVALAEATGKSIVEVSYAPEIDFSIIREAKQRLARCKLGEKNDG